MRRLAALSTCAILLLAACTVEPHGTSGGTSALEPRPDWSTALPQLLPGIRACLLDGGEDAVGVTKAWPIGLKLTGVRVLEEDGGRVDCVAAVGGDRVFLTERVPAASRLPGERDPLYTPAARRPPASPCLESTAAAEGWISYDVCRDPRPIGQAADRAPPPRMPALPQES